MKNKEIYISELRSKGVYSDNLIMDICLFVFETTESSVPIGKYYK